MQVFSQKIRQVLDDIKSRNCKSLYLIHGEEPYFIDRLADAFELEALPDGDKSFNQHVLYGNDLDTLRLISEAKRFPMMADRQLVLVKEAQLVKDLFGKAESDNTKSKNEGPQNAFQKICEQPIPSTILVLCVKGKVDGRKAFVKSIERNGGLIESEKIKDWDVAAWVAAFIKEKGFRINEEAATLLAEHIGNNLSKIENEINKLAISLSSGSAITSEVIEKNIGISKDFNVFELCNAISNQDILKANRIADYFIKNSKEIHPLSWIGSVYVYFTKLLLVHYHLAKGTTHDQISTAIKVNSVIYRRDYQEAIKRYSYQKVVKNIHTLRELDMRVKGFGRGNMSDADIIKEFIYKVIHTK